MESQALQEARKDIQELRNTQLEHARLMARFTLDTLLSSYEWNCAELLRLRRDSYSCVNEDAKEELAQCIIRQRARIATQKTEALRQAAALGVDITERLDFSF